MLSPTRAIATALAIFMMYASPLFAQDGELVDIDIDLGRDEWYESPWLWVGVGVFLLIALYILRRPKR